MDHSFSGTPPRSRALTAHGGPGGFVAMRQMWGQLWKPPAEALDSLTSVLSEHWRKARERTVRLFWPARPAGSRRSSRALPSPPHQRRKTHQVRLRIRIGAEAEAGTPVVDQVELHVAPSLGEQPLARPLIVGRVLASRDDPRIDVEHRLPD